MKPTIRRRLLIMACMVGLSPFSAPAKLVAWYPLDERANAPATVLEAVTGTDTGTSLIGFNTDPLLSFLTRGYPSVRPSLGTALLLTKGTNAGGGLNLGNGAPVQPTNRFTIAFWFKPLTFDAFDRFFESQSGNANAQDGIRIDTGAAPGNKVRVLLRDNNGATNTQFTHPLTLKNDGTWYFFAFRYDAASVGGPPFRMTVVEATAPTVDEPAITAATSGTAVVMNTGPLHYPHALNSLIGVELPTAGNPNNINAAFDEWAFYDDSDGQGVLTDLQLSDIYNFGPSGVKLINSFTTSAASVAPGSPATLSWNVTPPYDTVTLTDSAGTVTNVTAATTAGVGTRVVNPTEATTYWLRTTRGTAANVSTLRILSGAPPEIATFTALPRVIQTGASADLSWSVTGATGLVLDPGGVDVTGLTTKTVSPAATTTYTLSATNADGTSNRKTTVTVIPGVVPAHRYAAASSGNSEVLWSDDVGTANWVMSSAVRQDPLTIPSAHTNLTSAYTTLGGVSGGTVAAFQTPDLTTEVWVRPGLLTADHGVIFETGGGQNGFSILLSEAGFRFLGTTADIRNLDVTIPVTGLNLADFIQVVISTSSATDAVEMAVRDTYGNVRTASATADITLGANGATLFYWGSGALGLSLTNLGGRTEAANAEPAVLTGFTGEIALVNTYDRILTPTEIQTAFNSVATTVTPPPVAVPLAISSITRDAAANTLTLTWPTVSGRSYDAQFSTNLSGWSELGGPLPATSSSMTRTFSVPPNQLRFYIRVREFAAP